MTELTRRELLASLAAAPLALSQQGTVPAKGQAGDAKATIAAEDPHFQGSIRLPLTTGDDLRFASATAATLRPMPNGDIRVLVVGEWAVERLLELDVSGLMPNVTLSAAPLARLVRNWGPLGVGHTLAPGGREPVKR